MTSLVRNLRWRRLARIVLALWATGAVVWAQDATPEGGAVRGRVVGPDGPLAGVVVEVSGAGVPQNLLTDQNGGFEYRLSAAGPYPRVLTLRIEMQGYRPSRTTVRVDQPGQVVAPTIRLSPPALRVLVYSVERDGGQARELGGVAVTVLARDGSAPVSGVTNANGEFSTGLLPSGMYTIKASISGYEPTSDEVFIPPRSDTITTTMTMSRGPAIPVARSKQKYGAPNLPSETVHRVFQDDRGYMWFATDTGVARYDGANFDSSDQPTSALAPIDGQDVRAVAEFEGAIWFGTTQGLWRFNGEQLTQVTALAGAAVFDICRDLEGTAWLATNKGLYRRSEDGFGHFAEGVFERFALESGGSLAVFGGPPPGVWLITGHTVDAPAFARTAAVAGRTVRSLLTSRNGEVLIGTDDGPYVVVAETLEPYGVAEGVPRRMTNAMVQDSRGDIWFATDRGAVQFDQGRRVIDVQFENERINDLMLDREGNLWFATDKGAIRADLYSFVAIGTSQGLPTNNVTGIYPDPAGGADGVIWFITPAGVLRSRGAGTFEAYQDLPDLGRRDQVNHMLRDRAGVLWFATSRGLLRVAENEVVRVTEEPVRWLAEGDRGQVWAAVETGVVVVAGTEKPQPVPALAKYAATHIFFIGRHLWLATGRGAIRYDPGSRAIDAIDVARGLEGELVRWVAADRSNRIWLATYAGVELFDATTLERIDKNAGVEPGPDARTLLFDRDGFMWVGASTGSVRKIAFFDGGVVETVYTAEQGIAGSRVDAIVQDAKGHIWFATDGGAVQHAAIRTAPLVVAFTEVDGRRVTDAATVPSGQHSVRFAFHGVSMVGDVRYLYRLGTEGPWTLLPERQELIRDVVFEGLESGQYELQLRVLNRDLYGLDSSPVPRRIRIDVPIYKKAWFTVLALLALAGAVFGAGLVYRNRTREYVLPPELRTYVPIEPNPFIVGNPIRSETMFFGREDDFRYVRTKLEGASQGVVIVLCGERRTGKSSILYQILNGRLGPRFIPVFIDLQEMVIASDGEFFRRLARLVGEAVGFDRKVLDRFPFTDAGQNPYHLFVDYLDEALTAIESRTLLLLVDEYELLESKVEEGRLNPEIFLFLAGLIDSKERLSFVFTGSRRLEDRDRRYWREMLRRSLFRKIGFLSENDALRLIQDPVAGRVVYGRGVTDRVVRLTAGQPFYTQVICQNIVDDLNEHKRNAVTLKDLARVTAEIVDHPLPQMIYFWDGLSSDEKVVLSLLCAVLDDRDELSWVSSGDLAAYIDREEIPVDLSENTIHLTLEEMFRTEILDKNVLEGYRVRIDLLRSWIRRSHSIWQVLKE